MDQVKWTHLEARDYTHLWESEDTLGWGEFRAF